MDRIANKYIAAAGCVLLSACGPATSVYNNSNSRVYVDLTPRNGSQTPRAQLVDVANSMTAPWCSKEVAQIYVGISRERLHAFDPSKYCDLRKCNCTVAVSALMKS